MPPGAGGAQHADRLVRAIQELDPRVSSANAYVPLGLCVTVVSPLRHLKILVVDDAELSRRVVARMLTHAGYEAVCVHSGQAALACLERTHFDGMILDLKMPGMDGWQVMSAARSRTPNLPIVVHSAHAMSDPIFAHHRTCFLRKPYRPLDLQAALGEVL